MKSVTKTRFDFISFVLEYNYVHCNSVCDDKFKSSFENFYFIICTTQTYISIYFFYFIRYLFFKFLFV